VSQLEIIEWPSRILETPTIEVIDFNDEIRKTAAQMHDLMDKQSGIGLSANQVNLSQRMTTIYIPHREGEDEDEPKEWWHNQRFNLINPRIIKKKGRVRSMEGCLSFPDLFDFVERSEEVVVRACNEFGKETEFEANGLFAVCLQHEIDHLDGMVFINRMSRLKVNAIKKKLMERMRERQK
jgi:peptide deformylase